MQHNENHRKNWLRDSGSWFVNFRLPAIAGAEFE